LKNYKKNLLMRRERRRLKSNKFLIMRKKLSEQIRMKEKNVTSNLRKIKSTKSNYKKITLKCSICKIKRGLIKPKLEMTEFKKSWIQCLTCKKNQMLQKEHRKLDF
jgi:hypothetical protein